MVPLSFATHTLHLCSEPTVLLRKDLIQVMGSACWTLLVSVCLSATPILSLFPLIRLVWGLQRPSCFYLPRAETVGTHSELKSFHTYFHLPNPSSVPKYKSKGCLVEFFAVIFGSPLSAQYLLAETGIFIFLWGNCCHLVPLWWGW